MSALSELREAGDLCSADTLREAAKAACTYHGLLWHKVAPDMGNYPVWEHFNDAQREMRVREAIILVYVYLHFRSVANPAMETERLILLREVDPAWRQMLAKVMGIAVSELSERPIQKAYGHDVRDTEIALPLFAHDQRQSAGLLLEGFRREEIRRLEQKAWRMKYATFGDHEKEADERWHRRNVEIFHIAETRIALADEATASHNLRALESQEQDGG